VRWALLAGLLAATGGALFLAFSSNSSEAHRHTVLGHSVDGRQIEALEVGRAGAPVRVLVVGCIHGNEPAGIAIADALAQGRAVRGADLWILPDLNPDGVAADARQNADGVDLNRNFPWQWRPLGPPGTTFYAGPRALSEPESQIAQRLVLRVRPQVSIWFHQHLDVVDESGGDVRIERRFASLVQLPLRRLTRYAGSATGWENHTLPGTTSFVVELPAGHVSLERVGIFTRAIRSLAASR
jgi:murein peptide amidase A